MQRLNPGQLLVREVAVHGPDVRLKLLHGAGAGDDTVDAGLGQQPAEGSLGHVLALALQEPELLDPLKPKLEAIAGRAAPLLLGRDRLAGLELAAQEAPRQRG